MEKNPGALPRESIGQVEILAQNLEGMETERPLSSRRAVLLQWFAALGLTAIGAGVLAGCEKKEEAPSSQEGRDLTSLPIAAPGTQSMEAPDSEQLLAHTIRMEHPAGKPAKLLSGFKRGVTCEWTILSEELKPVISSDYTEALVIDPMPLGGEFYVRLRIKKPGGELVDIINFRLVGIDRDRTLGVTTHGSDPFRLNRRRKISSLESIGIHVSSP